MTVKELEERTGLSRANIRFYEQEGLLSPQRRDNGYRDYSGEDLTTLLRIKLLRQLEIPLEEIRRLIRDEAPLEALMARHAALLAGESQRLAAAREVCEEIRRGGFSYASLDPAPYLQRLSQAPAPRRSSETADRWEPCPWRRFFARYLDLSLYTGIYWLIVLLCLRKRHITGLGWDAAFTILALITMLFGEPLFLSRWGTTAGKWLLGLRVERRGSGRLTYGAALDRTFSAILDGMGLEIPLYSLFKLYHSYKACQENSAPLPWETEGVVMAQPQRPLQVFRYLAACALQAAVLAAAMLSLTLPPHRGALTAAEYVENFNYYMEQNQRYYRLTEEGTVVHCQDTGAPTISYLLEGDLTDCLRFTFEEEGGVLRAVTADYDYRYIGPDHQETDLVYLPQDVLQYAFLSAAGADSHLFQIKYLLDAAEQLCEAHIQVDYVGLVSSLTVEGTGYTPREGENIYIAYAPDRSCRLQARLTLSIP